MNWKTLKNKYPEIWDEIYNGMIIDLREYMPGADIQQFDNGNKDCRIIRIAHNAAFIACYALHKRK
uniref:Uncharacterized protein n=1 Tax=viral metagenome TaxID=1070528 RepID=A0A6M3M0M6_9ZZZZ